MEAIVVFGLVLAFLVGGMMLALTTGYLNTEQARASEQEERRGQMVRNAEAMPSFFAKSDRGELPGLPGFDEVLLGRLESHVREEQALVTEFIHCPSIHSLYRQAPQPPRLH